MDRILEIWPHSRIRAWRDTGDDLDWLARKIECALDNWEPIDVTVERLADALDFEHLKQIEGWNRRNLKPDRSPTGERVTDDLLEG